MVKAWELGEMLFGNRPKTSVSVCSDDIIFLLSCVYQIPCCPQRWSSFLTDTVSIWLEISLKLWCARHDLANLSAEVSGGS